MDARKNDVEVTDGNLVCPRCGSEFMHQDSYEIGERQVEDGPADVYKISGHSFQKERIDDQDAIYGVMRGYLVINFWCEGCSSQGVYDDLKLEIVQWKGNTCFKWYYKE